MTTMTVEAAVAAKERPILRFLAWLLGLANARAATSSHRRDLYDLKDRLLRRFAVRDGEDVQRIVDACHGWGFEGCEGKYCEKCRGTGIYQTRWVLLERWRLAGRVFHRPIGACLPRAVDYIDGRIHHDVPARVAAEAALWLALLFDRTLFWNLLARGGRFCGWQWRPMLALQVVVYEARSRTHAIRAALSRRECIHCGARFWRGRTARYVCRSCFAAIPEDAEYDLPF